MNETPLSNKEWYLKQDQLRSQKLERARACAGVTIPSELPPRSTSDASQIVLPFSSEAAKGINTLAAKILGVLLPLNDQPFFIFTLGIGQEPTPEQQTLLNSLATQLYRLISVGNLRDTALKVIKNLLITGDVLMVMDGLDTYRMIRLDQFVVTRDVDGTVRELGYLTWVPDYESMKDSLTSGVPTAVPTDSPYFKQGYKTVYVRIMREDADGKVTWTETRQFDDGTEAAPGGNYRVLPYFPLRWIALDGENYSRSHVEEYYGDINSLEAHTEALVHSMAAASTFWMMARNGGSVTVEQMRKAPIGSWQVGEGTDVSCVTPATALSPQIQYMVSAVATGRKQVAEIFLNSIPSIPEGERVTAAAIRMIGQQLEAGLGGPYVTIARQLLEQIASRAIEEALSKNLFDPRLRQLLEDKKLNISVITGLQSMDRDNRLTRLLQMGEMQRNLPPQATARFKWSEYNTALVSALGFEPENWVYSEAEWNQLMEKQRQTEFENQARMAALQGTAQVATNAAQQDLQQTGGQNIAQALQQGGGAPGMMA